MSQCLLVDPDQVQDVLQCGGITMPHEETKIDQVTMSQDAGEDSAYMYIQSQLIMYKSCIIMYLIVFDCIPLYHMGCHHVKPCQDGTDLAYFLQLQTRTTCMGLLECTCRFSFHCHPLRGLCLCMCGWCVSAQNPSKLRLHSD